MRVPVPLRHRGFIITVVQDRGQYVANITDPMDLAADFEEFRHTNLLAMLRSASRYIDRLCGEESAALTDRLAVPDRV